MVLKDNARKIINKVGPLLNRGIAVLDSDKKILDKTEDFTLDKKGVRKTKDNIISLSHNSRKIGYLWVEEKPKVIKEMSEILKSMVELYIDQLSLLENIPSQERYLNKFVYDLLSGDVKEEILLDEAEVFNIDLSIPRIVIAVTIGGGAKETLKKTGVKGEEKENLIVRTRKNIKTAIDSFYTTHKNNIIAYVGDSTFVILKDIGKDGVALKDTEVFKKKLDSLHYIISNEVRGSVIIGVGRYYEGIHGLSHSYGEALLAVHLGDDLWSKEGIYHFDSFGVIAPLVTGIDENVGDYARNFFSKFNNKDEVIKTLDIFFDTNMSLTETSRKLKIHRNTLVYRLDRINEILNLDPRKFDDAVQIKLAMLFSSFIVGEKL